jgi:acetoacetyl-CoA synthetase
MRGGAWFPEARLNFAENLLGGPIEALAVVEAGEAGIVRRVTRGQLRTLVARAAAGLKRLGVAPGDRIAGILPNTLEALVALLATASLGAVWSSCSPDFGVAGLLDRIGQIGPKLIVAAPVYRYAGRDHDIEDRLAEVVRGLPGLAALVTTGPGEALRGSVAAPVTPWSTLLGGQETEPEFLRLPFDQPLYILYTSGTTGLPKAIVHRAGGVLLQHVKEHRLQADIRPGDVVSWYANTAWMMYHWLVSALASSATIVLCDGAAIPKRAHPVEPGGQGASGLDPGLLWRVAEAAGVTHFGTSPKYLSTLAEAGYRPQAHHDLTRLRWLLSAGAPFSPESFDWVYDAVKSDMGVASISGGTEIIGCFLMGSPLHQVRRGQLACKALGMAVDVLDERGASVIGRKGELVCTEPFPSMPLTFWGEGGEGRYIQAYFAERPGLWSHGDLAEQTIHGSVIIHGRTDTTLKPGGVRIGTAEIYRIVEAFAEVADCLVFGAPLPGDEEIVLCLVPSAGSELTPELAARLRAAIRLQCSPRHVPHRIHGVAAIPYTLNGKRVEGAARAVLAGQAVRNLASLMNPDSLAEYGRLAREAAL